MSEKSIRIFISSPGDVKAERQAARQVIEHLQRKYVGRLSLHSIFWEEMPIDVLDAFQVGIDKALVELEKAGGIDIAIFILWSRLGSPTIELKAANGLREYPSGTVREWEYMMELREKNSNNGKEGHPTIFLYTRKDEESYKRLLNKCNNSAERRELDLQKDAVEAFIREKCKDPATGKNTGAHLDYRDSSQGDRNDGYELPSLFKPKLRAHLMGYLDRIAGLASGRPVWDIIERDCLPFRGLEVFDVEHSQIFYGREDEIVSIRAQLKAQAENGCAFVLIIGPSGSGKSSLGRAGVIPEIRELELDPAYGQWRYLTIKPSQLGNDLVTGLIRAFSTESSWSGLEEWQAELEEARKDNYEEFRLLFKTRVVDALRPKEGKGSTDRLILLLDQLEELFSDESITEQARKEFFGVIERLARSGYVWVIATVRSDFYEQCQNVESLTAMRQGEGTFDLRLPTTDALRRVIIGPATLAALKFEERGGKSLSDEILAQASEHKELLPLVEYLLLELCEQRTDDGKLTFEAFETLGGVKGALQRRCESTFESLSNAAKDSLGEVFSQLVSISGDEKEAIVRRTVNREMLTRRTELGELVNAMEQARLFTASLGPDSKGVVSVAHEALLRIWPRAIQWIELNRENLRIRSRLESDESRYREQPDESLLLQQGVRLQEAKKLFETGPELLTPEASEYVRKSIALDNAKTMRQRRNWVLALGLLACATVGTYWYVQRSARTTRVEGLVASLVESDPERLVENIEKLNSEFEAAEPLLRKNISVVASSPDNERRILHSKLALVAKDPSLTEDVTEAYFSKGVGYLLPIRQILRPQGESLIEPMAKRLKDSAEKPEARFRAAVALAEFQKQPSDLDWDQETTKFVAEQLVSANPEFQPIYRKGLRPIKAKLIDSLIGLFTDKSLKETQSLSAANSLADYAGDDPLKIADLLTEATLEQYAILYPLIEKKATAQAVSKLKEVASSLPADYLGSVPRIAFGQKRANAAVTMLKLGEKESVLPVFNWTDDPEALTQFIFRCKARGIPVGTLLDLLDLVSVDPMRYPKDTRYALLLSIGEYGRNEIPASRCETLIKKLADWYANDPSSGVHGAAGWLLRHLGEKEVAEGVDQQMELYSPDREWFTLAITVQPEEDKSNVSNGKPAKKTFYYTFIVHPKGEFTIGSLRDKPDRNKYELRHTVILTRPFALLDREITFEELIAFSLQYQKFMQQYDAAPSDPGFGAHWYDSVAFCRWLGQEMGLTETDQCYADPETLDEKQYPRDPQETSFPRNWPLDLSKRGFRLPTESEWEIAARSGSQTSYGFGSEVSLLDRFGWFRENSGEKVHPGREKRPSVRGMFDLHGNLFEWTHDWSGDFGESRQTDPLGLKTGSFRVNRGGSWNDEAAHCRSALRNRLDPSLRYPLMGFRLALSPSGIPQSPEADK